jgi:hypothetical protein
MELYIKDNLSDISYLSEILHFVQSRPRVLKRSEGRTYP